MFHYGRKPTNDINKDIGNINILQKNIYNYPEPVLSTNIKINNIIEYKDCFEISLLRFINIIFGKDNKIDINKIRRLIGNGYETNEFYNFISKYNNFDIKSDQYTSTFFRDIRTKWCNFLNNRDIFHYKFENKYKLTPSINNFFSFFSYFFNLRFTEESDNKNLSNLMKFLSPNNHFKAKLYKNGYIGKDKIYEETIIKIYVN
ncbi:MAG: hypothetical protein FGM30_05555, partial [Candidatus Fonsibacter sp.]|nr:hypothetical protein [Candidatus Fonsibacter sp.]